MSLRHRSLLAVFAVLALANPSRAAGPEERSLYWSWNVWAFFELDIKNSLRTELKVTAEQDAALKTLRDTKLTPLNLKIGKELAKMNSELKPGAEKARAMRAVETQGADDLFKLYAEVLRPEQIVRMKQIMLQFHGIDLLSYPEVRAALKITEKEAQALKTAHVKWARPASAQLLADVRAKRISDRDAMRRDIAISRGVSDPVRELLTVEQRRVLDELLGDLYYGEFK